MKTTVKVLGYTNEGLTIVELSNVQYDAIVLYNEDTLEIVKEIEWNDYLSMTVLQGEVNHPTLGSVSKLIVEGWFEQSVVVWDNL